MQPLLSKKEKVRFVFILCLSFVMAFVELGIAAIVALMAASFSGQNSAFLLKIIDTLQGIIGCDFFADQRFLVFSLLLSSLIGIVIKNILFSLQQWHVTAFSEGGVNVVRKKLLNFYLTAPYLLLLSLGNSRLTTALRLTTNIGGVFSNAIQVFSNVLMIVTIFTGLIIAAPIPSLLFFVTLGLTAWIVIKISQNTLRDLAARTAKAEKDFNLLESQAVSGLKELRLYTRELFVLSEYSQRLSIFLKVKKTLQSYARLPQALLESLGFSILCVVLLFLIYVQHADMAKISAIMGFLAAAAWRCLPVGNRLLEQLNAVRATLPYMGEVVGLLKQHVEMPAHNMENDDSLNFEDGLVVKDLCFTYPDACTPALQGLNFSIHPGEMVGIVGFSGAGKSSVVNLLTGLLLPSSGAISIGKTRLSSDNIRAWLRKISYVSQTTHLFDATLAENIALSRWGEPVDRDRVLECCQMASLDFLDSLENGIDTELGEGGARLSGGQAQRVAIARALYSRPSLIIFDEATSALDIRNETAIQQTILRLKNQIAVIVIAHRLSSVEGADRVVWLDEGKVLMDDLPEIVLPKYKLQLNSLKKKV